LAIPQKLLELYTSSSGTDGESPARKRKKKKRKRKVEESQVL
jgi:hypothetical protein